MSSNPHDVQIPPDQADPTDRAERTERAEEPFPDHHNDLAATLRFAWQMIGRGVQDRRSAFHTPVLSSNSPDGPQARVLVLRAADAPGRTLIFHTDTRSAKLPELAADPRVALTFYDAARKAQVRINGTATAHANNALSQQRWAASRPSSLRCYLGAQPSAASSLPTSGLPAHVEGREPELAELAIAEPHFAVLTVDVLQLEWLHLHTRGQRRARFTWAAETGQASQALEHKLGDSHGEGVSDAVRGEVCSMQWLNP